MIRKPCRNQCTTTSLAADLICKGCGLTDDERRLWGGFDSNRRAITLTLCQYRLANYEECVKYAKAK